MRYLATLLPTTILALPSSTLHPRADLPCTPTSYTLSDYTLTTSATSASVTFTFQSSFANTTGITDSVIDTATCVAEGASLPNSNVCDVEGRRLLFDLRAPQEQAYYQITHTWSCDGCVFPLCPALSSRL